ncbi:MAG: carboxypeptidase-like regulatory domain-containing protein [Longimicrobiales bacterium]
MSRTNSLLTGAALLGVAGCEVLSIEPDLSTLTVNGVVVNADQQDPIPDAAVIVEIRDGATYLTIDSTQTGQTGAYQLQFANPSPDSAYVSASAPGYRSSIRAPLNTRQARTRYDFELMPLGPDGGTQVGH